MKNENFKLGIIGDCHFGTRNGNHAMRSFARNWLLNYLIPLYKERGITDLFELGDWFDQRRYTLALDLHWQINEMIPLLAKNGMTLHMIVGNHSMALKDDTEVNSTNALVNAGIAHGSCCVKAYDKPTELTFGLTEVLVLPWVCDKNYEETVEAIDKSKATVVLHHPVFADFVISAGKLADHGTMCTSLFEKFELSLQGHYHLPSEKTLKSGTLMKYVGVPYHQNTADADYHADNGVHVLDCVTQELEFIPNPEGMSIFRTVSYDYEEIEYSGLVKEWNDFEYLEDNVHLKDSIIRVEVLNRDNSSHYKDFLTALKLVDCVNYTITDLTKQLDLVENKVDQKKWQLDPLSILLEKVDSTEGDNFNHEGVASKLKDVYTRCKENSNLVL